MARGLGVLAVATLVAGIALIAYAVGKGEAQLALVVIFPVVSGSSLPFLLGVLLVFVGLMASLSWGATYLAEEVHGVEAERPGPGQPIPSSGAGGVVLLGPIPLFFGAAKPWGRRHYALALLVAAVLFAVVLVLAWVF